MGPWFTGKNSARQVLRYDTYRLNMKEWLLYSAAGGGFAAAVSYVFYRSVLVFLITLPVAACYPILMKTRLKEQRLRTLTLEFKEGITILSSFLSAGYSVENAFSASVRELTVMYGREGLITREFSHMEGQMRMNRPVEQVLMEFADRCGLDDVRNFAEVFGVAKRSGGTLVAVISHTAAVIGDRILIQEEIETMNASKQFEQKIMNMIPFLIVIYIDITSPGFFDTMYKTGLGRIVMTVCLVIYLGAYVLSGQIMRIEV